MLITCVTSNGYENKFYLPSINSIDELKEYADKNIPIKCFEAYHMTCNDVFIKEALKECYVYLNNYMYYKVTDDKYNVLTYKENNFLVKTYCNNCSNTNSYGCLKFYNKSEDLSCKNFEKCFSFKEWFKNMFRKEAI